MAEEFSIAVSDPVLADVAMLAFGSMDLGEMAGKLLILIFAALVVLLQILLLFGIGYVLYYLFSLPRRRLERAMVFLNVVDAGVRQGLTQEETIKRAAACADDSLSMRFHLVAAWIERGDTWKEALIRVPRLLPPNITEMLLLADRIGGWDKVQSVCRRQLQDVLSELRARQSCLSPSLIILPLPIIFISTVLARVIIPKYHAIAADLGVEFSSFVNWMAYGPLPIFQWLCLLGLIPLGLLFAHVAGPRLWSAKLVSGKVGDYLHWHTPWQRKRMQRDFVTLLALLLDANVPEGEAVELAAKGTANAVLQGKADKVKNALAAGESLPEALDRIGSSGEFRWRFQNAAEGGSRFERALAGWCDALASRADQLQQTAMHTGSVLLLLINAAFVCLIALDVFGILIQITEKGLE